MKQIKNILVPTDFSVTARNAFRYAEHLAEKFSATITVVHVNEFFLPVSEVYVAPLLVNEEEDLKQAMNNFINEEYESSNTIVKKKIKTKILEGSIMQRIVELTESGEFDFVVMGSTGLQDFISKIIGSTSLYVAKHAHCPVLLVPRDAHWHPVEKILFASNSNSTSQQIVPAIKKITEKFGAEIHFIYVDEGQHQSEKVTDAVWKELFATSNPKFSFQIHTIKNSDAVRGLNDYAHKNNIDWSVFVSSHRTFWQKLIQRSVTERYSLASDKPTLVMHLE